MSKLNPKYDQAYREYMSARDEYHRLLMACQGNPTPELISQRDSAYQLYVAKQTALSSISPTLND